MGDVLDRLRLSTGSHRDPNTGVCVMEVAHLAMSARWVDGAWVMAEGTSLTDLPPCTHRAIAKVAQRLWDSSEDRDHHLRTLARFLPRLMRAKGTSNRRVEVRLALAAARFVEHLAPPEAKACNDTVERWLAGEATEDEVKQAADAAYFAYFAAAAAYAAYAADAAAYAAATAYADAAGLEALLDHLLTALDKAKAEEGEALWDPEPWEQDAIEFVDALMADIERELEADHG